MLVLPVNDAKNMHEYFGHLERKISSNNDIVDDDVTASVGLGGIYTQYAETVRKNKEEMWPCQRRHNKNFYN